MPAMQGVAGRLGIITGTTAYRDAEGRVWINHAIGRLCEELRRRAPHARICLPILPRHQANLNHVLDFPAGDVVDLPPLLSTIHAQRYYLQTRRTLRRFAASVDRLFIRLPFQLPDALRRLSTPKLMHVVGNPLEVVRASSDYSGVMKWLARRFAAHSNTVMRRMAAEPQTRVCSNGEEMWRLLDCRHGRVVVSSCLQRAEIRPRSDFTLHAPPRILFVGYVRPEKGVGVLLDAFEQLRAARPLKLSIVGGSDRVTSVERQLRDRIAGSPYAADIEVHGMVSFGEALFEQFRKHDALVQPSLSEGTPRTLVEARAFGCPVVASRVGGIPSSVNDGVDGLLVEPGDAASLSSAIARLLDDGALRRRLIEAGLKRSDEFTIEHFADTLLAELDLLGRPVEPGIK